MNINTALRSDHFTLSTSSFTFASTHLGVYLLLRHCQVPHPVDAAARGGRYALNDGVELFVQRRQSPFGTPFFLTRH